MGSIYKEECASSRDSLSLGCAVGLALLYASAYYLPLLGKGMMGLLPSVWDYIFVPTAAVLIILSPSLLIIDNIARRSPRSRWKQIFYLLGLLIFSLIAIKGMFSAVDYPWVSALGLAVGSIEKAADRNLQAVVILILIMMLSFIFYERSRRVMATHVLSAIGYAFLIIAVYRVSEFPPVVRVPYIKNNKASEYKINKQVVWVIFDELDYGEVFGGKKNSASLHLVNFGKLAKQALSAEQAYSPAKDTSSSIPAMLSGRAITGISFNGPANLTLRHGNQPDSFLTEETSVFGRLPGGAQTASIVGFALPYCAYFESVKFCHSYFAGNAGRWYDALTFFSQSLFAVRHWIDGAVDLIPENIWSKFDYSYRATTGIVHDALGLLRNGDQSLIYLHVNLPHLPGSYAQRKMHMAQTSDPLVIYRENLIVADDLLGKIIFELEQAKSRRDVLLIVSSDHWLRMGSQLESKPIPFLAWRLGESTGSVITQPISTVHTGDLIIDYLNGKVDSQSDIKRWWNGKKFYPTWMPPQNYEY